MKPEQIKKITELPGEGGLPSHYPVPEESPDLLFYIQRNQNENTVIYEVNRDLSGLINLSLPMVASWIQFSWGGQKKALNLIQNKLAYGYSSSEISTELIKFQFVSYDKLSFFIVKNQENNLYTVKTNINGKNSTLKNIYVYAQELGVFPDVKFIELYGEECGSTLPIYEKIQIQR